MAASYLDFKDFKENRLIHQQTSRQTLFVNVNETTDGRSQLMVSSLGQRMKNDSPSYVSHVLRKQKTQS